MTKYRIRNYYIVKTDIKEIKKYTGYLTLEGDISKNGRWFTQLELYELFDGQELEKIKNFNHPNFEMEYSNEEYNRLINAIYNLPKETFDKDFIIENFANFDGVSLILHKKEDNTTRNGVRKDGTEYSYLIERDLYEMDLIMKNGDRISSDSHQDKWAKLFLIDRIRRYFDYDDPYRKP